MIRRIKNLKHLLFAFLAVLYNRYPARRLRVVGVTGTDGKTTTVNLIEHLLSQAGQKVGMISTTGAKILSKPLDIGFHVTTPGSGQIQKLLRQMVDAGVEVVVVEATSIGLDQHRLFGCRFEVGVLTNITPEHLDYHHSYEKYLVAKAKLFRGVKLFVLNRDDRSFEYFLSTINNKQSIITRYGLSDDANLTPKTFPFKTTLPGDFNQLNCLAAIAVAKHFGINDVAIRHSLAGFRLPPGRLEEISHKHAFRVFVDFAHTPGAFAQLLPTVKKMISGRLIHVFGCTGDRDKFKRELMGEIAGKHDDVIILTHEDTYSEDPAQIISTIEPGVVKTGKITGKSYWKIPDRREAIKKALSLAKKGDAVLITGVGHQKTLNLGGKEIPWSDQEVVREILSKK